MKQKISDLMDLAAPLAVDLPEQAAPVEAICARTLEKVQAEKPKKSGRRRPRVALIAACAACAAALLLGSVLGGEQVHSVLFPDTGEPGVTYYMNAGQTFIDGEVPDTFDVIYLPTHLPEDARMRDAWYAGSRDSYYTGYQWGWEIGQEQMVFGQYWVESLPDRGIPVNDDTVRKYGRIEFDDISVNYTRLMTSGKTIGWELVWFNKPYAFELIYTGDIPLKDLGPTVTSLAPISREESEELLKTYAPEDVYLSRPALEQVLVPQKLSWSPKVEADAATFYLMSSQAALHQVVFYQEDTDCLSESVGIGGRRWKMKQSRDLSSTELAGQKVQLLDGRNSREYFWEQEGNWCYLRIHWEGARALGLTVEELAEQIVESLTPVSWKEAYDALK